MPPALSRPHFVPLQQELLKHAAKHGVALLAWHCNSAPASMLYQLPCSSRFHAPSDRSCWSAAPSTAWRRLHGMASRLHPAPFPPCQQELLQRAAKHGVAPITWEELGEQRDPVAFSHGGRLLSFAVMAGRLQLRWAAACVCCECRCFLCFCWRAG